MPSDAYVKDKTKEDILTELVGTAQMGSSVHEQQKAAILVRCTEDLEHKADLFIEVLGGATEVFEGQAKALTEAIHEASASSGRLTRVLIGLNVILALATITMAITAVLSLG